MRDFDDLNSKVNKHEQSAKDELRAQQTKEAKKKYEATKIRYVLEPSLKKAINWYISYCDNQPEPTLEVLGYGTYYKIDFDGIWLEINGKNFEKEEGLYWELLLHTTNLPFVRGMSREIDRKAGHFSIEEVVDVAQDMITKLASRKNFD